MYYYDLKFPAILDLKIDEDGEQTIRGYLEALLLTLWEEQDEFSGKRPFGDSGWDHDLIIPLIRNDIIEGTLDEEGYIEKCDSKAGYDIIDLCIRYIFEHS